MEKQDRVQVEDFTTLKINNDPQFTTDGDAFVFVSTQVNRDLDDYESKLYYQGLTDEAPRQWTFQSKVKDEYPRFSPDGKWVVFQSTRSGRPQLWLLSTKGGEARQITFFKHGATNPHWLKNGKQIVFHARLEKDADIQRQSEPTADEEQQINKRQQERPLVIKDLQHKSDAEGFFDDRRSQLILYDLEHETFTQLTKDFIDHHFEDGSPDGNKLLYTTSKVQGQAEYIKDIYELDLTTKEVTKLTKGDGTYSQPTYSPSGNKIAYIGNDFSYKSATLNNLYVLDVTTEETTVISKAWDLQIGDVLIGDTRLGHATTGPVWSKDETKLFFIGSTKGTTGLFAGHLDGTKTTLYKEDHHVFTFAYHPEEEDFILGISSPTNPGEFYHFKEGQALKQITHLNADYVNRVSLQDPEEITVTAEDGWKIQGWLMKPYGFEEGKKYPMILEIHGGPHVMYGRTYFHEMQLLASKGYAVLYTNPRGSHGYGQTFVNAVRNDHGGKDYKDLMSAVDYVLEHYDFIDEDRLGVTGGSYGGFMTNWIVGHTNRFKAAVTQRSISNRLSSFGTSDIGYRIIEWAFGVDLFDGFDKLWDFSPLKYVENVETPLLILHSENDYRCPIEQAEQLFTALKYLGKEVEFVRFPGANHELSRSGKPSLRIERLKHICRWFDQYL